MTYVPPPFPAGLKPGRATPSARGLQKALKAAGYMNRFVLPSPNYGKSTQAAVRKFHAANPKYGAAADAAIGPKGWAELHREAYEPKTVAPGEPKHDYRRVYYGGRLVNARTKVMLQRAEIKFGGKFTLTQGSYNRGVGASAGTHDGGGVVDIAVNAYSSSRRKDLVEALRRAGFAAWLRTPAEGFQYHVHACAIGDREMASAARSQVAAYFAGRNGLAGNGPDSAPASVGRPYPAWAAKYR